jgi:small subunit ribosomal protein S2
MKAGAHFGHQTFRWDPKMQPYIFTNRNGIHIIDLDRTLEAVKQSYFFVRDIVAQGKEVLFVGTKRQAQDVLIESAEAAGMPFVVYRWLGGMLTNFNTIRGSVERLEKIQATLASEDKQINHTKKELVNLSKDAAKLSRNLSGIAKMKKLPGVLFVIDPKTEHIAILEAKREGIPVVAVTDTNCDPSNLDIVIPGNDDAIKAIELFAEVIREACLEGKQIFDQRIQNEQAEARETAARNKAAAQAEKEAAEQAKKDAIEQKKKDAEEKSAEDTK